MVKGWGEAVLASSVLRGRGGSLWLLSWPDELSMSRDVGVW